MRTTEVFMRFETLRRDIAELGALLREENGACGPGCSSLGATAFHLSRAQNEAHTAYQSFNEAVAYGEVPQR